MRFPPSPLGVEHATHSTDRRASNSRTSVAARQAQLDAAMREGPEPTLPLPVLEARLERLSERINQAVSDTPTPNLLEMARQADRRRSSLARGGRPGHCH